MRRIGFERDGGHADYVAVPAANLVAVPAEISYAAAAILPDAVACMYHSLIHQGKVGIGQRVLILGAGGLGIHGVQIARSAGAEVLATSRRWERLTLAEEYGAVVVNTKDQSLENAVAAFTHGEGVDVVVDNIGTRDSVSQGLSVLRPGGKLLLVGYLDETLEIPSMRFFKTGAGDHRLSRQHEAGSDRCRPAGAGGTDHAGYRRALQARTDRRGRRAPCLGRPRGRIVLTRS